MTNNPDLDRIVKEVLADQRAGSACAHIHHSMKITDLEDADQLVTKDYLKGELQQLRSDLLQQLMANQRWTTGLIIVAYTLIIGVHFVK